MLIDISLLKKRPLSGRFFIIYNHFNSTYEDLNKTDKVILSEFATFYKETKDRDLWTNYNLKDKTIVALNGTFGKAYLINPSKEIKNLFVTKIEMPKDKNIKVYRISALDPRLLKIRLDFGNFNTIGKKYSLYGNDIYYTKYDSKKSITQKYTSRHYITFLTHEAFHYYMQDKWSDGGRFTGDLSKDDIELISSEYDTLADIQIELQKPEISKEKLLKDAQTYVDIMAKRIKLNPEYLKEELAMETAEGTANYVSIKASKIVNYDYGIMYFDNTKNVKFSEVVPMLKLGKIDSSFLADRMPYETGALLCELADALEINNWQEKLNQQIKKEPIYIYNIIKDYLN